MTKVTETTSYTMDLLASNDAGDDPSSMEPDNDRSFGVAADDGLDEEEFDEPGGCLVSWESTDDESTESG
jgi:hypothetical protein